MFLKRMLEGALDFQLHSSGVMLNLFRLPGTWRGLVRGLFEEMKRIYQLIFPGDVAMSETGNSYNNSASAASAKLSSKHCFVNNQYHGELSGR